MIPVRVPADLKPLLANERRFPPMDPDHPLADFPCPVCDGPLGEKVTVLVFCGIASEDRKDGPGRWTTGGAVAVHAECAGVSEETAPAPATAGETDGT